MKHLYRAFRFGVLVFLLCLLLLLLAVGSGRATVMGRPMTVLHALSFALGIGANWVLLVLLVFRPRD